MAGNQTTDRDRWAATREGDERAFSELFRIHRDRVFRYALKLGCTASDADEVTAGAFFELWRRRSTVRVVNDSILGWLLVTTFNLSRNNFRSLRRYKTVIEQLPRSYSQLGVAEIAERELQAKEDLQTVVKGMKGLSRTNKALITLTVWEGLNIKEAAVAVGVSPSAARMRLHRVRNFLQDLVTAEHDSELEDC